MNETDHKYVVTTWRGRPRKYTAEQLYRLLGLHRGLPWRPDSWITAPAIEFAKISKYLSFPADYALGVQSIILEHSQEFRASHPSSPAHQDDDQAFQLCFTEAYQDKLGRVACRRFLNQCIRDTTGYDLSHYEPLLIDVDQVWHDWREHQYDQVDSWLYDPIPLSITEYIAYLRADWDRTLTTAQRRRSQSATSKPIEPGQEAPSTQGLT